MKEPCLTYQQEEIIRQMAKNDMKVERVVAETGHCRNTVVYRIVKIEKETGLNARKFYDLVKLLRMIGDDLDGTID